MALWNGADEVEGSLIAVPRGVVLEMLLDCDIVTFWNGAYEVDVMEGSLILVHKGTVLDVPWLLLEPDVVTLWTGAEEVEPSVTAVPRGTVLDLL